MSNFMDRFKSAMDFMSCNVPNEKEVGTKLTNPEEMAVGMKFVDNCVVYTVKDIKIKKGIYCIYATTESNKADGWFTRDSYDVITV